MTFRKSITILYSTDIAASLDFYTQKLGFQQKWDWGSPPDFGGVVRDDVEVFFCLKNQGHPGTWFCIVVDNVDEFYESVKNNGVEILSTPTTQEWNMREMIIKDPDGHFIRIGQNTNCD